MVSFLLLFVASFILHTIEKFSYLGLIILMALESANIPLPSELIMPFAGYLVYLGKMNLLTAAFAGAIGCLLGSLLSYAIGYYGGRLFVEKYGKYLLLSHHDLDLSDMFFAKYGELFVFISRLLPIVRTFISLPAGITRMNIWKFSMYTFVGSFIWCYVLGYIGVKLGKHQAILSQYFHKFDIAIGVIILAAAAYYIYTHVKTLMS